MNGMLVLFVFVTNIYFCHKYDCLLEIYKRELSSFYRCCLAPGTSPSSGASEDIKKKHVFIIYRLKQLD